MRQGAVETHRSRFWPMSGALVAGSALTDAPPLIRQQIAAALSKLISAHIGDICVVMSRAPAHKHYSLADIEWKVMPAVLAGQFYVAEAEHKEHGVRAPVAVVTWARVSAEVDARLTESAGTPIRLRPDEWTSGDIIWLVDIVGDQQGISGALTVLAVSAFKDRAAKITVREETGSVRVETLKALMTAALAGDVGRN
jgi:hemolysin-activating ACP:hemolysin acyltransferase